MAERSSPPPSTPPNIPLRQSDSGMKVEEKAAGGGLKNGRENSPPISKDIRRDGGEMAKTEVKKKNKGGRPKKTFDWDQIGRMCSKLCTRQEICDILKTTPETLELACLRQNKASFSDFYEQKMGEAKLSLRRRQFQVALGSPAEYDENGNLVRRELPPSVAMLIWLGKQNLGQREPIQITGANGSPLIPSREDPFEELAALLRSSEIALPEKR